jgi:hypothetical protein
MRNAKFWRLTVSAITAGGLCLAGAGTALAGTAGRAQVGVTISTASSFVQVGGDTMVRYGGTAAAGTATVSGTVTGIPAGVKSVVVTLLSEPFGASDFTSTGKQYTGQASDGTAGYSFSVSPGSNLATGYEAQVSYAGATTTTISAAQTVYVIPQVTAVTTACTTRPICHGLLTVTAKYPSTVFANEAAKTWYTYAGIRTSATTTPAGPATLRRYGTPARVVTDPATGTSHFTVPFMFVLGHGGYQWKLNYCTRDSESLDGLGLPGHHGCGDVTVSASAPYLG